MVFFIGVYLISVLINLIGSGCANYFDKKKNRGQIEPDFVLIYFPIINEFYAILFIIAGIGIMGFAIIELFDAIVNYLLKKVFG